MDNSFGIIMTVAALVIGILILTGNGSIFLKGGRDDKRTRLYDPRAFEIATGVMLLAFALFTGIDCFTVGMPWKIAYVVAIILTFALYVVALRFKCRLPEEQQKKEKKSSHVVKSKNYKK